jgi:ribosomal protein S6
MENEIEEKESGASIYEVGYIMVPTIAEENLATEVGDFKDALLKKGAIFISDEHPKMLELAYEMSRSINNKKQKFSYGYFGWVKFECTTTQARVIKDMLDKDEKLVRYLFVKTVRENTMSSKRTFTRSETTRKRSTPKAQEVNEEIDETVIDKEIDALVLE